MSVGWWAPLELALNRYVDLDPEAWPLLEPLQGKVVAVTVRGLDLTIHLRVGDRALHVLSDVEEGADTCICGTPVALAKLGLSRGQSLPSDVEISGDLDVGRRFKSFLDTIDVDWEEHASRMVGDVLAHKVGSAVRGLKAWGEQVLHTTAENAAEYLQEERRDVPNADEMAVFLNQVDTLRADVDRVEARVKRLQQRLANDER